MRIISSYYGGSVQSEENQQRVPKYYPATGEVIGEVEIATSAMIDAAVAAASDAQRQWAKVPVIERGQIMMACAHALRAANAELSRLEVEDVGKVYAEAASADVPSGRCHGISWRGGDDLYRHTSSVA